MRGLAFRDYIDLAEEFQDILPRKISVKQAESVGFCGFRVFEDTELKRWVL